jgi:hypothetical protein
VAQKQALLISAAGQAVANGALDEPNKAGVALEDFKQELFKSTAPSRRVEVIMISPRLSPMRSYGAAKARCR